MKKIMAVVMLLVCLGMGGFIYNEWKKMDTEPPIIQYEGDKIYPSGASEEELLKNVTALDSQDGNVSETLLVEQIIEKDNIAEVVYVARDQNNNISKFHVELSLATPTPMPTPVPTATPTPLPTPTVAAEEAEEEKETETAETEEKSPQELAREEQERIIAELPEGAPKLYLTEYYIELNEGEEPDYVAYVEAIEDSDEEDINELWQRIIIDGSVDSSQPGTYELQYYVIDSNGIPSNTATLTVVVR